MFRRTLTVILLAASPVLAATAPAFESALFNGKNLDGWVVENGGTFAVEDGVIKMSGGNGWLRSRWDYEDFTLHVEYRCTSKAEKYDSGVFFKANREGKPFAKPKQQVNLLAGQEGFLSGNKKGAHTLKIKPPGEWNSFDLTVAGTRGELLINGEKAWAVDDLPAGRGFIGLQAEGFEFEFRAIRIREAGFAPLFDGKDLAGFEPHDKSAEPSVWTAADGVLSCTGKKGPWLATVKEYQDFTLRLEFLLDAGGNSGVFVHVPREGHSSELGFEVQMLDDAAPQYAKLKPAQYCGSVYLIAAPAAKAAGPAGEWQQLEIACKAGAVQVRLNGILVVDTDSDKSPELKKRRSKGYLGFQNHSTPVKLRGIRLQEP